ncbi:MAG: adenosylmethionine decarboxylase [Gammaproteobacteria bacterium]|nr:MAG: adenosylmethionine decarboxylase [Gammaproteobacteria bacterium]
MHSLGRQIVAEFYHCEEACLADSDYIAAVMQGAAEVAGATIVTQTFHEFSPHGVSGVVVIAESHLSIHTWPEHGYAAVDLFTCGDAVSPELAFDHLKTCLKAGQVSTMELRRGQLEMMAPTPAALAADDTVTPLRRAGSGPA